MRCGMGGGMGCGGGEWYGQKSCAKAKYIAACWIGHGIVLSIYSPLLVPL